MRTWFLMNLVLMLVWVALTGSFTYMNVFFGFFLAYIIIWMMGHNEQGKKYVRLIPRLGSFVLYFIYQIVKANLYVAYDIVTAHNYMKPGIVRVPLDASSDFEITLLANFISLTPGTLSLDVSTDKKAIYVHAMYIDSEDAFIADIKNGFERRILEILR